MKKELKPLLREIKENYQILMSHTKKELLRISSVDEKFDSIRDTLEKVEVMEQKLRSKSEQY